MKITVQPVPCAAAYERAKKEIRKEASLPGFRKGKIPDELLVNQYGDEILKRMRSIVLSTSFNEAVKLIGRKPFSDHSIRRASVDSCSSEKGAEITIEYEAFPEVPAIAVEDLNLDYATPPEVTEEQYQERYESLRYTHSERIPITDRPAEEGDEVVCTVQEIAEPKTVFFKEEDFYLKKSQVPDWLLEAVTGMKCEETKEVTIPPSAEGTDPIPAILTLHSVYTCKLPEENDEFAKSCGALSMEDLHSKLRRHLELSGFHAAFERVRRQLKNELIRLYAFDLPQTLVEHETESRFTSYMEDLRAHHQEATDKEGLRKSFLDEVKRQYTLYFLFHPILLSLNPSYTQKELMEELVYQAKGIAPTQCVLHNSLSEEEIKNRLIINIAIRKCEEYLIEKRLGVKPPEG